MKKSSCSLLCAAVALAACDSTPAATNVAAEAAPAKPEPAAHISSYTAKDLDFSFAENAVRYKRQVVNSINMLMRSDPRCVGGTMIPDTLISVDEKRSSNPLLQIACTDKSGSKRPVLFHAKDGES